MVHKQINVVIYHNIPDDVSFVPDRLDITSQQTQTFRVGFMATGIRAHQQCLESPLKGCIKITGPCNNTDMGWIMELLSEGPGTWVLI